MQLVTYLTNCQTTEVRLTKKFSKKSLGKMHIDKQGTQFFLVILLLHDRH